MADDDPFAQGEVEKIGELGRHCGHGHDRRTLAQHDAALRLARRAKHFERVELRFERQIALDETGPNASCGPRAKSETIVSIPGIEGREAHRTADKSKHGGVAPDSHAIEQQRHVKPGPREAS